jgi:hypothetical protein
MMTRWVAGVVVLFGILLLMLPNTDEKSLSRIASTSMLACTKDMREQVIRQLEQEQPVNTEHKNPCPDQIASLELNESGELVIKGKKYPITMRMRPVIEDNGSHWSCRGEPVDHITKLCKP